MRVDLDIPGGPISVVLTGVKHHDTNSLGWWTVGGRKLMCQQVLDGPWQLTGHGRPARRASSEHFGPPPRSLRIAFRAHLLSKYRAGDVVDPGVLDRMHKEGQCSWGYDEANEWHWRTPNDGDGWLLGANILKWMRAQGAKVGVQIRDESDPE